MRGRFAFLCTIVFLAEVAAAGCRRRAVIEAAADAPPFAVKSPGEIKREVNDTLTKEHERTLKDIVH
jgi:hypothetical protein